MPTDMLAIAEKKITVQEFLERDRKMKVYRRTDVQEYWIVDPKSRSVEVYVLRESDYEMTDFATEKGTVQSMLLEGLKVDLNDISG